MTEKSITGRTFYIFLALVVNGVILFTIPNLALHQTRKSASSFFNPIFLANYQPPEPPPPKPERRVRKEEKIPKKVPKVTVKQRKVTTQRPRMRLEMPEISFEINPALTTGMAVAPPPPPPVKPVKAEPTPAPVVQSLPDEFQADEVDQIPHVVKAVRDYPRRARRRGIEGSVTLKCLVGPDGRVKESAVVEANPEGIFEKSALSSIRRYVFRPGYYKGKPVPTWIILPIHYKLSS